MFSKIGWEATQKLELLEEERWLLDDLWDDLRDDLGQTVQRLEKIAARWDQFAAQATIKEREARAVLATMPGVGVITVETVLAELGDWERFHGGAAVVSFADLDPGVRESDGRRKDLQLTKAGSPLLRWILIQLAHRMKRTTKRGQTIFERWSARIGKKKATCAIARRLLLVIYAMLRDGQAYQLPAAA